ncbi:3-hydroxyisobutyryl-CoA hydrolase, mitochondrial-like [Atheta coriaria]|uniref:3-hydroxyisobutyryl-CoA hydrolase, mitochondrial-like n=1 Tax=Dalotia coriaria TaxID=877792 RepID=UPI0031F3D751
MNSEPPVLFETYYNKGIITLNRPDKLNAINYDIIQKISEHLIQWQCQKFLLVIIKGNGRAFSAGGDLVSLQRAQNGEYDFKQHAVVILYLAYTLVGQIPNYKPNFISFMDGIVMGGGAGLSIHGKYRIITERTIFAMPETTIGFFPDVGASYFLSRLQGRLGLYLGLTGERLQGEEIVIFGLGTHFVPSDLLPDLEKRLMECHDDYDIEVTLDCFHRYTFDLEDDKEVQLKEINSCFDAESVEEILLRLSENGSKFCLKTRETLMGKSPTSLKITFEAWKRGRSMSLIDCLNMEYRMASRCLSVKHQLNLGHKIKPHSDFKEGVRALLIHKDKTPQWYPKTLEDVSQELVDSYFHEADNICHDFIR